VAKSGPHRQSRWLLGLPPLIVEDPPSSTDSNSSSSRNQSPKSHTESIWMTDNSSLLEDFFMEGFLHHFNTPLTNLLDPIVAPVVLVLHSLVGGTLPSIQSTPQGLWNYRDIVSPLPLPQSMVIITLVMWNPAILFIPGTITHITPSISGTQQMPSPTPTVQQNIPSTSATYSAPYNTQCGTMGAVPVHQHQGQPQMYDSNPQIQISRAVPNMYMPARNLTVPPLFLGMHG